jgi:hypothetical protein
METKDLIVFVAVFFVLAIRLYMKYIKKDKGKPAGGAKQSSTSFPSLSKDDDYEPYSKK